MQRVGQLTEGSVSLSAGMQALPGELPDGVGDAYLTHCFPEHLSVFSLCVVLGLKQRGLFFQLVGSGGQLVHVQVLEGQG